MEENNKIVLSSQMHITIHLTLQVGSNLSHLTPYFILGWNRWNVWFGMKEGSGHPGCILYLTSFSSEYTWVLFNGPNGHWVTPGQPSNTLFKSHNTQAQDFWTRRAMANKEWYATQRWRGQFLGHRLLLFLGGNRLLLFFLGVGGIQYHIWTKSWYIWVNC